MDAKVAKFYSIREPEGNEQMKPLIVQFSLSIQQLNCSAMNAIKYSTINLHE